MKNELIREKLIREILDIFNIRLFCKNKLFKVLKQFKKNNYQKEEHVKAVRYKMCKLSA